MTDALKCNLFPALMEKALKREVMAKKYFMILMLTSYIQRKITGNLSSAKCLI